jgi:hypothetical protein
LRVDATKNRIQIGFVAGDSIASRSTQPKTQFGWLNNPR